MPRATLLSSDDRAPPLHIFNNSNNNNNGGALSSREQRGPVQVHHLETSSTTKQPSSHVIRMTC